MIGRKHTCFHKTRTWTNSKEKVKTSDRDKVDKTRQDKTRQDKTRQDKTRQDKTRQDKTRQDNGYDKHKDNSEEKDRIRDGNKSYTHKTTARQPQDHRKTITIQDDKRHETRRDETRRDETRRDEKDTGTLRDRGQGTGDRGRDLG